MNNFFDFLDAINNLRGEVVGRDTVGDYLVDTYYTADCGWETAICKNDYWIVVQRYKTLEEAKTGHNIWRVMCLNEPDGFYSVQYKREMMFKKEN